MRMASYNVENLFLRARALNQPTWSEGKEALRMHAELNGILNKARYSASDKKKIVTLLTALGLDKKDDGGGFAILRQNHGRLIKRPKAGGMEVVAEGRADWLGWVELKIDQVNEIATQNTARVIADVAADVLGVVEAESRPALLRFSEQLLPQVECEPYEHVMLIDGNDERGIDVGIMCRSDYEITDMRSHVDDSDEEGKLFSRDCAEYWLRTPKGNHLVVLVNHLKSKGYGAQNDSDARRLRQAHRVKEIYDGLVKSGMKNVAVVGDFNDTPDSEPLAPLLINSGLKDISKHHNFDDGGRPGTYGTGAKSNKIDYLLLSPPLFKAVTAGGIFRKGVWGGTNGTLFPHYEEITKPGQAASDHAALWADLDF